MAGTQTTESFTEELAAFFASQPTREAILAYRPSKRVQRRAALLLQKQNDGEASHEERQELEAFAHAERLMRLLKAQLRGSKKSKA
ncbi:MAG: hypothetical protein K2R98_13710 [Gemmataceae bacterium]|nr:hypothetical protein [Gemmataceae bacterium]